MILVDAGVLIAYLRRRLDPKIERSPANLDCGVCGITRAELLHGARNDAHRAVTIEFLDQFEPVPIREPLWDLVGLRLCELRKRGITVPFADAVLATLAIHLDIEAWSIDARFPLMAKHLPLKLYNPA